ncbi:MAG: ABC transporter substrate-binding protein [Thermoanaerobaculales bacterium]|nr:ABC transporter substrate-binding protein [Thermoanaerobaculales bacterium]
MNFNNGAPIRATKGDGIMVGHRKIALLFMTTVAIGLTGCSVKPVVGVVLPATGPAGVYGESIESGMRLAISDARTKGELPVGFEVIWANSESDPDRAKEEFRRLVEVKGAKIMLGAATSDEAWALLPLLEDLNVVCLSPSASTPGLTRESKLFFRIYPSDELEGQTAGKFMMDRLGASKVLLVAGNTEYVRGIEPEFRRQYEESLGGSVVARVDLQDEDWTTQLHQALRRHQPKAVYLVGYSGEILEMIREIKKAAFSGRIVTTSAFYISEAIKNAGEDAEGILFPLPPYDRTSDKEPVASFVIKYMDTYERAPDVFAAHGYDAMRVAIQVLTIANPPHTPEIKKALHFGVTDFMGVTGPILFDDYGDVKHYPKMFIVKDGQVQTYRRYLETERKRILRQVQALLIAEG